MKAHLTWRIELDIEQTDDESKATASIRLPDSTRLSSHGKSRRHPDDPVRTQVGEELATARALNGLAQRILRKAAHEIEQSTHQPAHPHP
ncbi:DUF1876 domain-containing protein [Streptomyces shenzhenensis]|uniref:DUF1876 domain-containing protein n=1 Tax=Streptomyces shenzhenensis TaxID=943815 RepID=A0A3M0I697_9ACTN|nr:DUF1876 domain-containing protein [Streptomyces shenzhenensis]RMB82283.1 hypothetical protein CTZ28_29490 [Streptomyces shenzhenensis]